MTQKPIPTRPYAAPSLRLALPSPAWYIRDIVNKLTFGFSYTKSKERSPAVVSHTNWSWNTLMRYQVNLSPDYFIQPFQKLFQGIWLLEDYRDLKIYFSPQNISWSVAANRSRENDTKNRQLGNGAGNGGNPENNFSGKLTHYDRNLGKKSSQLT